MPAAEPGGPTILLTGANGQVGFELRRSLHPFGRIVAPPRAMLDLAEADSIVTAIREVRPAIIVNAGAYTAVDLAESEPGPAMAVNGHAPGIIAEEAQRIGAGVIHFSTDYVFDGEKQTAYVETDVPRPLNAYGASKLAGEQALAQQGGRYLVLRTSWVHAPRGKNFVRTMLRLGRERPELRVVNDQYGAPTSAACIAEATAALLSRMERDDWPTGIYHMTCSGSTTWLGFAQAIFLHGPPGPRPRLVAVPGSAYATAARRPRNSVLSNAKLWAQFGVQLPPWQAALQACLRALPEADD